MPVFYAAAGSRTPDAKSEALWPAMRPKTISVKSLQEDPIKSKVFYHKSEK